MAGNVAVDQTTNGRDGTYGTGIERGVEGLLTADSNTAIGLSKNGRVTGGNFFNFNSTNSFSVEFITNDIHDHPVGICGRWTGTNSTSFKGWQVVTRGGEKQKLELRLVNTWGTNALRVESARSIDVVSRHVVITYNGSKSSTGVKMYFDGEAVGVDTITNNLTGSITTTGTFEVHNRNVSIVESSAQRDVGFYVLDELAVYESVLSATRARDHFDARKTPWGNQRSDVRVGKLMELAGFSTADFNLEPGVVTLGPIANEISAILDAVNEVERSEVGAFYVGGDGKFNFDHRYQNVIENSSVVATYIDKESTEGHSYSQLVPSLDDGNLWTEVRASRDGTSTSVVQSSTDLVDAYGKRVLEWTGNWASDPMAECAAGQLLAKYQDPEQRFLTIEFPPNPDYWADVLPRELNRERIRVERHPPNGAPLCREVVIEGVSHSISASPKDWRATWTLGDADPTISNPIKVGTSKISSTGTASGSTSVLVR